MTIYIVSAGRSGSGWLATCLMAAGLRTVHEWTPHNVIDPEVVADTTLVWNADTFLDNLKPTDAVIVLDRDRKEIEASVTKLVGNHDWSVLFSRFERLKEGLRDAAKRGTLVATVEHKHLFSLEGLGRVCGLLERIYLNLDLRRLEEIWDFMQHMRVTNKSVEERVKSSYDF